MNPYLARLEPYFSLPKKHVKLNRERLSAFVYEVALQELEAPSWKEPVYPVDDLEFVQFLGMGSSINFYYTDLATGEKFQTLWPECGLCRQVVSFYAEIGKRKFRCIAHGVEATMWGGAYAMWACLKRAEGDGISITDARFLRDKQKWTKELARFVFRGTEPVPVIPMLIERHKLLRDSAVFLEGYRNKWMNVFKLAKFRAFNDGSGAVELLANFSSYHDEYLGFSGSSGPAIPFYKRAHLFVQMYEGRARASEVLPRIKDPELLILPADYELPRALRAKQITEYSPALLERIVNKREVKEGSRMEIEIRLATVEAGEILEKEINFLRKAHNLPLYTKVETDYLLWTSGRAHSETHHITRTTKY
ncbi:MAG: queuosine salvage family protein [bacterium]|nr:queuosine salvage family protein [bacterium]